jgi:hypothetical protein
LSTITRSSSMDPGSSWMYGVVNTTL